MGPILTRYFGLLGVLGVLHRGKKEHGSGRGFQVVRHVTHVCGHTYHFIFGDLAFVQSRNWVYESEQSIHAGQLAASIGTAFDGRRRDSSTPADLSLLSLLKVIRRR